MKETVNTLTASFHVTESPDELITISRSNSYLPLVFSSRQELWELVDKLKEIIPRPIQSDVIDRYIGEAGKYD